MKIRELVLKPKALTLLVIFVFYLLTGLAFIYFKENINFFLILLTLFFAVQILICRRILDSIHASIKRGVQAYEDCLSNGYSGSDLNVFAENHEYCQVFKNQDRVINNYRQLIDSASDTSDLLQEYSQGIIEASGSLNNTNEEITGKTVIVNDNISDIEKNIENTSFLLSDVMENVIVIASATEEMSATITTLATASGQASSGVEQVSELVEQISGSIDNVAGSAQDVSASVDSIVTSVKEINLSLNKVNSNCERSMSITLDAGNKAKDTNNIISDLDNSTKQIGKIVDVINKISNQTNMLALNAAIEAAGAGEAGKGFAVVASEVKVLANQTAKATEEIRQQIENMQGNMSRAVAAVGMINEVIEEITEISKTIGLAVTEQYVATGEITSAVVKSAEKVNNISEKILQVAGNAQNAARNINESSKGIKDIAHSAAEISTASNEVARNAEKSSTSIYDLTVTFQEVSSGSKAISENITGFLSTFSQYADIGYRLNQYAQKLSEASQKLNIISRY
ncbi:MAG: methyl-accepting chemotaxis protein [Syntrophomonas sp.]